ncbi:acetyl-CoA carboxylase biotin carboxyl carrier protein subunit [Castellaniella sp.]|uniref:acetyl-CoA carboxylase biotin carboxyl carrier protein subunit n=1 Tax=Castellaniella sp. TaxID=1955812 RepID=UPI003A8CB2B0
MATIEIKSEITGSVAKILHKVGDAVVEDDPIIILESMKMEIPVTSTEDGEITEILVQVGDTVAEGSVVARVTEKEN